MAIMKKMEPIPRRPIPTAKKKFNPKPNAPINQQPAANPEPYKKKEDAEEATGTNAAADAMKTARKIMALTKNLGITKTISSAAGRIASMPLKAAQQASRMINRTAAVPGIAVRSVARFAVNTATPPLQAARKISGFVARATARLLSTTQSFAQKKTIAPASIKPAQVVKRATQTPTTTVKKITKTATSTAAREKPVKSVKKAATKTVNSAKKIAGQAILSPFLSAFKTATPQSKMATIAIAAKKVKAGMLQAAKKAQQEAVIQSTGMRPK